MTESAWWSLQLGSTLFMTGLIWFVQLVHYPQFAGVGDERFAEYEREHQRRTTWVVAAPMLLEALSAGWLTWLRPERLFDPAWSAALALLLLIWASTALLQMPLHARLESGPDPAAVRRLVRSNWLRTVGWSGRAVLLLAAPLAV